MLDDIPKYARTEFERRWLVDAAARQPIEEAFATLITDRYIARSRLRLRRMDRPDLRETKFKLTRKEECADPSARPITNLYLTEEEHRLLATLPAANLNKRRLHFRHQGRWWSLDLFDGALTGIEIVECEADSAEELAALHPPNWVLHEVTHLAQWQCGSLAANGIPEDEWPIS